MSQGKPILIQNNDTYSIKIDNGDHYYLGSVTQEMFPSDLKNYVEVVEKSLLNYSDNCEKIINSITKMEDGKMFYTINYSITYGSFTRSFEIPILLSYHKKEQMDYINERFGQLETQIKFLTEQNSNLTKSLAEISKQLDESAESEEESEEEDNKSIEIKKPVEKAATKNESSGTSSKRRSRGGVYA